jgi:hypothetical protein
MLSGIVMGWKGSVQQATFQAASVILRQVQEFRRANFGPSFTGVNLMKNTAGKAVKKALHGMSALAVSLTVMLGTSVDARADEADAKRLLKAMSDYLAAQKAISFKYDATLEIITKEEQKLGLVSSGGVTINRPDKIRSERAGGFADVETTFDGKTLTVLGKNLNVYAQQDIPGTIDNLIDVWRTKYHRHLPAANLLLSNSYDALMQDVIDVKDLGSGVIGGVECDYVALRKKEVDWQIWIAQGNRPYPCRYSIATKDIAGQPQYVVQIGDWKTGNEVGATDFSFKNRTKAKEVELGKLEGAGDLPAHFKIGETK